MQSNQRAELTAVLHVLQTEARPVHVKTDSEYVLKGCISHRGVWRSLGWQGVQNKDLWQEVDALLEQKGMDNFMISKVKGHASWKDVRNGTATREDKLGNDAADRLAREGAASHALSPEYVQQAKARLMVAREVQAMMIEIVAARAAKDKSMKHTTRSSMHPRNSNDNSNYSDSNSSSRSGGNSSSRSHSRSSSLSDIRSRRQSRVRDDGSQLDDVSLEQRQLQIFSGTNAPT